MTYMKYKNEITCSNSDCVEEYGKAMMGIGKVSPMWESMSESPD